jgi:ribonuclease P protein component
MLSQERRISQSLFAQISKEGRSFQTPRLSLRISQRKDQGKSAFSFVIPAKAVKTAVGRNFLKRRGRHVIKKHLSSIKDGYLCAFFLKKDMIGLPFPIFEQGILSGLKQANLLK